MTLVTLYAASSFSFSMFPNIGCWRDIRYKKQCILDINYRYGSYTVWWLKKICNDG